MTEDSAAELADLRDEVDKFVQLHEDANARLGTIVGNDAAEVVSVVVAADGSIESVTVSALWRNAYDARDLGGAVQQAIVAAGAARAEAWATLYADASTKEPRRVRPVPRPHDSLAGQLEALSDSSASVSVAAQLEELLGLFKAINDGIDEASTRITTHLAAHFVGHSSYRCVRATLSGAGAVIDLSFDSQWASDADHAELGREISESIRDAQRQLDDDGIANATESSGIGKVQGLAQDPRFLADRLRLRG